MLSDFKGSLNDLPKNVAWRTGGLLYGFSVTRAEDGIWKATFRIKAGGHQIAFYEGPECGDCLENAVWCLENTKPTLFRNRYPPKTRAYRRLENY